MNSSSPEPRSALLVASGAGLGLTLFGINWFLGAFTCGTDTSYCARGGSKREWQGRVFTAGGQPATRPVVRFGFESMRTEGPTKPTPRISIQGDELGRYCFRWPLERVTALIDVRDVRSSAEPDPRFAAAAKEDFTTPLAEDVPIVISPDVEPERRISAESDKALRLSAKLWRAEIDAAGECLDLAVQPPWYRVDDLRENWRYRLLQYLSLGCIGIALAALVIRRRRRQVATVALSLACVDGVLMLLIWGTKTI